MKILKIAIIAILSLAAAACGDEERFRIEGTIEGNPTMNLRAGYYAEDAYHTVITAAREGAFEFYGSAPAGTVVDIFDYDNNLLGRTYAANGQELRLELTRGNAWNIRASGNETAAAWADFLRRNADIAGTDSANSVIAEYIGSHPEALESSLMLVGNFNAAADPAGADSLMQLIAPAARPAAITEGFNFLLQRMVAAGASEPVEPFIYFGADKRNSTFKPSESDYNLLAVTNNRSGRADSIVPALKRLQSRKHLAVLEYSIDADTIEWKRNIRRDTATWTQAWGAGGFSARGISRLAIPSVPYFIVCDSTGSQLLRTHSISRAERFINDL